MLAELTICAAVALLGADEAVKPDQPSVEKAAKVQKSSEVKQAENAKLKSGKPKKKNKKKSNKLTLIAIERNIVKYTNEERRQHGLPEFTVDHGLVRSARRHCQWMTENRALQHTGDSVAENIAMGYGHSREAVQAWMNSSGHRANILNGGHLRIGVAAYRTESGTIYWCQQFRR